MFVYPNIDPVIFHVYGPISVRWYGLAYLLGLCVSWYFGAKQCAESDVINKERYADIIFCTMFGLVVGGRLGYMIFYHSSMLIAEPLSMLRVWEGGMSFHGALLGAVLAMYYAAKKYRVSFWSIADKVSCYVPVGLFFGRAANFINGELWGRVTQMPWGVVYPHVDSHPRHPSQLYEMLGEGIVLYCIITFCRRLNLPTGYQSGIFLVGYGIIRFLLEFFREPDQHIGYVLFSTLTMGQLLTIPMIFMGLFLFWYIGKHDKNRYT